MGNVRLLPRSPYGVLKEIPNFVIMYYNGVSQPHSRKPNFGWGNFPTGRGFPK